MKSFICFVKTSETKSQIQIRTRGWLVNIPLNLVHGLLSRIKISLASTHRNLAVGGVAALGIKLALGSVELEPRPLGLGHAPHYH